MAIGRHECSSARDTDFRQAIAIGLDEALTALEESFYDLDDRQMQAFVIPKHNCIAWIVVHTLQNLDEYTYQADSGQTTFPHDYKWDLWDCREDQRPKPGDAFPSQAQLMGWLRSLRANAERILRQADERSLFGRPGGHWPGNRADMYMRTIFHAMAHVRQIWLLRGALGLIEGKSWPQQHWA